MQTRLAGRILLEEESAGKLFVIPSKKSWQLPFIAAWLALWLIWPYHSVMAAWRGLLHPGRTDWFDALWGIGWLFGIAFAVWTLLWDLGGTERLRVNMSDVELTRSLFGITFWRRSVPTSEVRNLRYIPESSVRRRYRPGHISFEGSGGTVSFGKPLSEGEGLAIIEQMLHVYSFPKKDRALEYIDLSS